MSHQMQLRPVHLLGALALALSVTACGRVSQVGQVPRMTQPESSVEFQAMAGSGYGMDELPEF